MGAKTKEGKAASSRNAFADGLMKNIRSLSKELNQILSRQRKQIDDICVFLVNRPSVTASKRPLIITAKRPPKTIPNQPPITASIGQN